MFCDADKVSRSAVTSRYLCPVRSDWENRWERKPDIWWYGSDISSAKAEPCNGLWVNTKRFFSPFFLLGNLGYFVVLRIPCFPQLHQTEMHPKLTLSLKSTLSSTNRSLYCFKQLCVCFFFRDQPWAKALGVAATSKLGKKAQFLSRALI